MQGQLPAEAEDGLPAEQRLEQRLLVDARPGRGLPVLRVARVGHPVQDGGRDQVAAQAARPEHVDAAARERGDTVLEQAGELVAVERDLVGHPDLEQPVQDGPRLGRGTQGDAGVGARAVAEAVTGVRSGLGPQRGGVAQVQRVLLVVDLRDQPDPARGEVLLGGLDAQREPHQVRAVVGGLAHLVAHPGQPLGQAGLEPRSGARPGAGRLDGPAPARPGPGRPSGGRRGHGQAGGGGRGGRPRDGVDDGGEHAAHHAERPLGVEVGAGSPGLRQPAHPVVVPVVEGGHAPGGAVVGGAQPARRDQAQAEQRGPAEQAHAGMQVGAGVGLGEDRERGAHRQRHRASAVVGAEGDLRVTRGVGGAEDRRTRHGNEAHRPTSPPARPTDDPRPPRRHASPHRRRRRRPHRSPCR